jgi:hypothetical protein
MVAMNYGAPHQYGTRGPLVVPVSQEFLTQFWFKNLPVFFLEPDSVGKMTLNLAIGIERLAQMIVMIAVCWQGCALAFL